MTIDAILNDVIKREGPFNHLKADKGGATNWGITLGTLQHVRPGSTVADLKALTPDAAMTIYREMYFVAPGIHKLPEVLWPVMVDFGINSGPGTAIKALQEVIGVTADGSIGPKTIAAALAAGDVTTGISKWRVMMIGRIVRRDPSQLVFLQGWLNRALSFIEA